MDAWATIAQLRPKDALLVQESPSNGGDLVQVWPAEQPESYFTFASGGLGWNGPAAVGIALAQKQNKTSRQTVLAIGHGSLPILCAKHLHRGSTQSQAHIPGATQ